MNHYLNQPRWTEQKLTADTKPKVRYEYWVTGHGQFPEDMLRHDCAWPATGQDAVLLMSHYLYNDVTERLKNRSIKMRSYQKPEVDRWRSFGWTVSQFDLKL